MFRICFIDSDLTVFDLTSDINCLSETFFLDLSLYVGKDLIILDPNGEVVGSCMDGVFFWW